jgi:hypothetical protein
MIRKLESIMGMTDAVWARHTNPISVWSRIVSVPLPFVVIWFRDELGLMTIAVLAATAVWFWINPRLFPEPKSKSSWTSRSILGEQAWLRPDRPEPLVMHKFWAWTTYILGGFGLMIATWALVVGSAIYLAIGSLLLMVSKTIFLAVMVRYLRHIRASCPAAANNLEIPGLDR